MLPKLILACSDDVLSSDGLRAARQEPSAVAAGIDDEPVEVERGWDLAEVRVLREGGGKSHP